MVRPDRLRVLRVIARTNVGGPAQHVALLTARLDGERFDTTLVIGRPGRGEGDLFALRPDLAAGVADRLVRLPSLGRAVNPLADARAAAAIHRLIGDFRPHILHTHTAKAGALARPLAAVHRVPVVVHTFHGTTFTGHFPSAAGRAAAIAERALGAITDAVVAVSPAVAADLHIRGVANDKVHTVPLGLDLAPFEAVPPLQPSARTEVALVARLVPVKDVPLAIDAVRLARRSVPDLTLVVAGDGPLGKQLRRSAPSWARFLGNVADIPALLTNSRAVVLSSHSEGSPVALIEALAAGRPVAAVPVGGVVDVLAGHAGAALASDRTPDALAEALVAVLTEGTYAAAAESHRGAIVHRFGVGRLVADIESLYDELWAEVSPRR